MKDQELELIVAAILATGMGPAASHQEMVKRYAFMLSELRAMAGRTRERTVAIDR